MNLMKSKEGTSLRKRYDTKYYDGKSSQLSIKNDIENVLMLTEIK